MVAGGWLIGGRFVSGGLDRMAWEVWGVKVRGSGDKAAFVKVLTADSMIG